MTARLDIRRASSAAGMRRSARACRPARRGSLHRRSMERAWRLDMVVARAACGVAGRGSRTEQGAVEHAEWAPKLPSAAPGSPTMMSSRTVVGSIVVGAGHPAVSADEASVVAASGEVRVGAASRPASGARGAPAQPAIRTRATRRTTCMAASHVPRQPGDRGSVCATSVGILHARTTGTVALGWRHRATARDMNRP